jgi:hypothetical protein
MKTLGSRNLKLAKKMQKIASDPYDKLGKMYYSIGKRYGFDKASKVADENRHLSIKADEVFLKVQAGEATVDEFKDSLRAYCQALQAGWKAIRDETGKS